MLSIDLFLSAATKSVENGSYCEIVGCYCLLLCASSDCSGRLVVDCPASLLQRYVYMLFMHGTAVCVNGAMRAVGANITQDPLSGDTVVSARVQLCLLDQWADICFTDVTITDSAGIQRGW